MQARVQNRPSSRRGSLWTFAVFSALAFLLAPLLLVSPAHALGEEEAFDLPLRKESVPVAAGTVTSIPLRALVEPGALEDLDLAAGRLHIPDGLSEEDSARMAVASDGLSLNVADEGSWSVTGQGLVFRPESHLEEPPTPIGLSIGSVHDTRSDPVDIQLELAPEETTELTTSAGSGARVDLEGLDDPAVDRVDLRLDGLPSGATVTADASRLVIPGEGTWSIDARESSAWFAPGSSHLGRQPSRVHYFAQAADGTLLSTGTIAMTTPVLPNLTRAESYGRAVTFDLGSSAQNVEAETLGLVPFTDLPVQQDGDTDTVEVPDQGVWELDRDALTVTFTPADDEVNAAAPMGITGADGSDNTADVAVLRVGYPALPAQAQQGAPEQPVVFDALAPARDVSADSLRFDEEGQAEGAEVSEDGRILEIPGSGKWKIDNESRSVVFTPYVEAEAGSISQARITADGVHASDPATTELTAQILDTPTTSRDDEARTVPGRSVSVDLVANDTAGTPSRPLDASTLRIQSVEAANLDELDGWQGHRLVIPSEGVYTVGSDGVLTFDPADGYMGRTTPIGYTIQDSDGNTSQGQVAVQVNPDLEMGDDAEGEEAGINALLAGLRPEETSTSRAYLAIVLTMMFAGVCSLWIGARMEADRRAWRD